MCAIRIVELHRIPLILSGCSTLVQRFVKGNFSLCLDFNLFSGVGFGSQVSLYFSVLLGCFKLLPCS